MTKFDPAWTQSPVIRDQRKMVIAVVGVAMLVVIAEICGVFGLW